MKEVAIGIDIGGTNTEFGIIDKHGNYFYEGSIPTRTYPEIEVFISALYKKIEVSLNKINGKFDVKGIGIGAPMGNYINGNIEHAAGLPWKGIVPLGDIFKKISGYPIIVTNDANAAAVGEMIYGGAKGMKNFIVITLGTGLGSGFVVNGQLVCGSFGFAGELGHTIVRPGKEGRECNCGRKGCLETYVSATGIKRTVYKLLADSNLDSEMRDVSFNDLSSIMISEAAKRGDKIAIEAFEHTGEMLGFKLADVVAHTEPEAIFLFGGLALSGDLIIEPTKLHMEANLLEVYRDRVKLLASGIKSNNAAVLGASALVWQKLKNENK
ncbi:ROK family protein [Bacteroidota bacterium]